MSIPTQELIDRGFSKNCETADILLIFPPTTVAERYGKKTTGNSGGDLPPLGIMYIAGYLRHHGYGVGFLDGCALNTSIEEIVSVIEERQPKSIGISATTFAFYKAVDLAQQIKYLERSNFTFTINQQVKAIIVFHWMKRGGSGVGSSQNNKQIWIMFLNLLS